VGSPPTALGSLHGRDEDEDEDDAEEEAVSPGLAHGELLSFDPLAVETEQAEDSGGSSTIFQRRWPVWTSQTRCGF